MLFATRGARFWRRERWKRTTKRAEPPTLVRWRKGERRSGSPHRGGRAGVAPTVTNMTMTTNSTPHTSILAEAQKGPAEKMLDLVLSSSAHLWHNRPGLDVAGTWTAKRGAKKDVAARATAVKPGLFV